jgi:hypothetical protein
MPTRKDIILPDFVVPPGGFQTIARDTRPVAPLKHISPDNLPLKDNHDLMFAHERYLGALELSRNIICKTRYLKHRSLTQVQSV